MQINKIETWRATCGARRTRDLIRGQTQAFQPIRDQDSKGQPIRSPKTEKILDCLPGLVTLSAIIINIMSRVSRHLAQLELNPVIKIELHFLHNSFKSDIYYNFSRKMNREFIMYENGRFLMRNIKDTVLGL